MQDMRETEQEGGRTGGRQDRNEAGQEGGRGRLLAEQYLYKTRWMQHRTDTGQDECKLMGETINVGEVESDSGDVELEDARHEGCRTGGRNDRRNEDRRGAGQEESSYPSHDVGSDVTAIFRFLFFSPFHI